MYGIPQATAFPRFNAGVVYRMRMQRTGVTVSPRKTLYVQPGDWLGVVAKANN
jgi:hypothetical protein